MDKVMIKANNLYSTAQLLRLVGLEETAHILRAYRSILIDTVTFDFVMLYDNEFVDSYTGKEYSIRVKIKREHGE